MKNLLILLLGTLFLYACEPKKQKQDENTETKFQPIPIPYHLEMEGERYDLPKKLKEISGLSYYKNNQLACVNDEDGKVFMYDLTKKEIVEKIPFGKDGDYEGIEVIGNEVFILKSNGKINSFKIGEAFERTIDCTDPDVIEYEGLGYDPKNKRLLLAAKERVKDKDEKKMIYAYDFDRKVLFKNIAIPQEQITDKANGKDFRPSGIAVNPLTGQYFILASDGKKLLILSESGKKEALISLNPKIFKQPEGICFSPDGTLYIASEGKDGDGYILSFGISQ
jgi:uncharacterized protein YjiK